MLQEKICINEKKKYAIVLCAEEALSSRLLGSLKPMLVYQMVAVAH